MPYFAHWIHVYNKQLKKFEYQAFNKYSDDLMNIASIFEMKKMGSLMQISRNWANIQIFT